MPGRYILCEGADFVGKSTLVTNLAALLPNVVVTRHPGATPLGQVIRKLVKSPDTFNELAGGNVTVDPVSAQLLMVVDHIAYINDVLKPSLAAGKVMIADRSNAISGLIYGLAEGAKLEDLAGMLRIAQSPAPDAVFILQAPMSVLDERMKSRTVTDRFELSKVRKTVHKLYSMIKSDRDLSEVISGFVPLGRIHYIDATKSPEDLAATLAKTIQEL